MKRLAIVLFAALTLSGCSFLGDSYSDDTATTLQQHVLAVSEAVAASDFARAQAGLTELQSAADTARAEGEISEERYQDIVSASALVQADVDAAVAAAEAAAAEQARLAAEEAARLAEEAKDDEDNSDRGKGKNDD